MKVLRGMWKVAYYFLDEGFVWILVIIVVLGSYFLLFKDREFNSNVNTNTEIEHAADIDNNTNETKVNMIFEDDKDFDEPSNIDDPNNP